MQILDTGPQPYVVDIEAVTTQNTNFRTTIWTGQCLQMTTMSVPVGGEIGLEVHHDTDQFIRVEAGAATVHIGATKDTLQDMGEAVPGYGIFVPTGMWHNIINSGDVPLQVYSIYAPAHHPRNTVHETFADAVAAEEIHD